MRNKVIINYKLLSPYRLVRKKVKILLAERELRNVDIARAKHIQVEALCHNIAGKGRNLAIQEAIADALGVRLADISIPVVHHQHKKKKAKKKRAPRLAPQPRDGAAESPAPDSPS
jgi:hypothetical protein